MQYKQPKLTELSACQKEMAGGSGEHRTAPRCDAALSAGASRGCHWRAAELEYDMSFGCNLLCQTPTSAEMLPPSRGAVLLGA